MKSIYLVLSYTGSLPSFIIRLFTKKKYTHVSISLNKELTEMYSFGRKYLILPIPGAFVKENINKGLYKKKKVPILVKEIIITNKQYEELLKTLSLFESNPVYYDYKGAVGIYLNKDLFGEHGYVCSSFVNETLRKINVETVKDNWEIEPEDFMYLENSVVVYKGLSFDYNKEEIYNGKFLESILRRIKFRCNN